MRACFCLQRRENNSEAGFDGFWKVLFVCHAFRSHSFHATDPGVGQTPHKNNNNNNNNNNDNEKTNRKRDLPRLQERHKEAGL